MLARCSSWLNALTSELLILPAYILWLLPIKAFLLSFVRVALSGPSPNRQLNRSLHVRLESRAGIDLFFRRWADHVPLLENLAILHAKNVGQSVGRRAARRREPAMQENHLFLGDGPDDLPSRFRSFGNDLRQKLGRPFSRALRNLRFVLNEIGCHV